MHRVRTRVGVWLVLLLACGSPALALNPALNIDQYGHTAWTIRDGFFNGAVLSLAQTPDGYLWVGTESGLYRFDGVRAVRWDSAGQQRLPHESITKLLVSRDGRLWIGTMQGLASWKGGRLIAYPELSGQLIDAFAEDAQGTVWVGTIASPTARLCAIRAAVKCEEDARFGNGVFSLLADRGSLWVGATNGVWRWTPGNPAEYRTGGTASDLRRIPNGPLVVAVQAGLMQIVGEKLEPYLPNVRWDAQPRRLLVDRDGGVWIGSSRTGLAHLRQGRPDVITTVQGLSSDSVEAVFEDREGNIWVGTNEGLDRFRELPVTTMSSRQGLAADMANSVLPARDGSIWIASRNGVTRWRNGQATSYQISSGLPDNRVGTLFEDGRGRILAATLRGVASFADGRFSPMGGLSSSRVIYNIIEDRSGGLWVTDQDHGLVHLVNDEVVTSTPWTAFGHTDHATAMVEDRPRGGLWIGFYYGGVVFVQDGAVRASYGIADGLAAGRIAELQIEPDGTVWAATATGLTRITADRLTTLSSRNGLPCDAVHWMLTDHDGSRWLMLPCGLARITSAEWSAWLAEPARSITSLVFTSGDGVRTQSTPLGVTPAAARLSNGQLWFARNTGIGIVDPAHLVLNAVAPPVGIEAIVADHQPYATGAGATVFLPPRTHDVQIDYTALSLTAPERVRFRYRLDGRDQDWQEVGSRRQVFYTDLRPGQYRFHVTAANAAGVWNDAGAALDFSITPAYYQTNWFLALSVATVLALVWSTYRLRVRVVERHQREISALNERLMKAQEQERIRIAGELHDGVMQQMLAATMMLGTAKRRIANNPDAAATIDKVQDKLVQAGTEIRQLSHDLHPPLLQESGLPGAMRAYCEQFAAASGIEIDCDVDDSARDLSRGASLALFRIVQEALANTAKHARATHVTVRGQRTGDVVSLVIADNGVGFDTGWLGINAAGGLGLVMMRERTTQLNGTFEFESAPGRGTTITVRIPFR